MKKILSFSLCWLAMVSFASLQNASADVIDFDNFNYADGALTVVSGGKWSNHSGTAETLLVANQQAVVREDGSAAEDANIVFTGVSGDIYYGLDFTVQSGGGTFEDDGEYFAHFRVDGTFDFSARLDIVGAQGGGDFSVGIASDDGTADAVWATDLSYDTTYRAIVRYDQDINQAELWIDPTSSTDTSILGDDQADPGDAVDSFALRQSNSDLDETVLVDNLVIGSTFDSVLTPVPEPGALSVLAMFGLAGLVRRRK
jgi:uncharacterized protein (TIGR03382 family)